MLNSELKILIEEYIKPAGITDKRILSAFSKIPRHEFVLPQYRDYAYQDMPLPIGEGQTISQPSLVGTMTQLLKLKGNEKVLEIGTGSGYQVAILSRLARQIYSVEIIKKLADKARKILQKQGIKNVTVVLGNGTIGLPKYAPYDAIIVTAGVPTIPQSLIDQLKEGGRLVIPIGEQIDMQKLTVGVKKNTNLKLEEIEPVRFVPLVGRYGWEKSRN